MDCRSGVPSGALRLPDSYAGSLEKGKVIMRCSKCGYISFDHLESCPKCHKPMAQTQLKGTVYQVVAPLFFQPVQRDEVEAVGDEIEDILDPDLDLLADEGDEVVDFGGSLSDEQEIAMEVDVQSSDGEISPGDDFAKAFAAEAYATEPEPAADLVIDPSGFEDVPVHGQPGQSKRPEPLEIPDELADISDLAPPAAALHPALGTAALDNLDLDLEDDLKLDDLKLSFGDEENTGSAPAVEQDDMLSLSLDDIDLSGDLKMVSPPPPSRSGNDDLDFDFNLEGIEEKKKEEQKKSSEDFPDFTLSLD